jgi:hypothetical protein
MKSDQGVAEGVFLRRGRRGETDENRREVHGQAHAA